MQNGVLTIEGEKKLEHEEEKENYHVMERRYGGFQRSLRIPDTVNEDKIEARFDKGVLKVVLPKRPEVAAEHRKIEIPVGAARTSCRRRSPVALAVAALWR
jgi:HSP20 family protein